MFCCSRKDLLSGRNEPATDMVSCPNSFQPDQSGDTGKRGATFRRSIVGFVSCIASLSRKLRLRARRAPGEGGVEIPSTFELVFQLHVMHVTQFGFTYNYMLNRVLDHDSDDRRNPL